MGLVNWVKRKLPGAYNSKTVKTALGIGALNQAANTTFNVINTLRKDPSAIASNLTVLFSGLFHLSANYIPNLINNLSLYIKYQQLLRDLDLDENSLPNAQLLLIFETIQFIALFPTTFIPGYSATTDIKSEHPTEMSMQAISMSVAFTLRTIEGLWFNQAIQKVKDKINEVQIHQAKVECIDQINTFEEQYEEALEELTPQHLEVYNRQIKYWVQAGLTFQRFFECSPAELANITNQPVIDLLKDQVINSNQGLRIQPYHLPTFQNHIIASWVKSLKSEVKEAIINQILGCNEEQNTLEILSNPKNRNKLSSKKITLQLLLPRQAANMQVENAIQAPPAINRPGPP